MYRLDGKSYVDYVGVDYLGECFVEVEIESIEQIAEAFNIAPQERGIQGILIRCYRSVWEGVNMTDGHQGLDAVILHTYWSAQTCIG